MIFRVTVLTVASIILSTCSSLTFGKDIRSLQKIDPVYVDLSKEYTPDDTQFRAWNGKIFPGPFFCKGRYIAYYKDRSGTYFLPPDNCAAPVVVGVWVPDTPEKDNYDYWFIVKRVSLRCTHYDPLEICGILLDWLQSLEAGDYKKVGHSIIGKEFKEEFSHPIKLSIHP